MLYEQDKKEIFFRIESHSLGKQEPSGRSAKITALKYIHSVSSTQKTDYSLFLTVIQILNST